MSKYKGMYGLHKLNDLYLRDTYIVQDEARYRVKVLDFFAKHGLEATKDAFNVSRSTIYLWKSYLRLSEGRIDALNNASRAPKNKRKSKVNTNIIDYIRQIRLKWPNTGKEKIKPLLDEYCRQNELQTVSESTIGRIIKKYEMFYCLRKKNKRNRPPKKRLRRGKYQPGKPGDLVQIDTIVKIENGIRRYIITAICLVSRFTFAYCYRSPSSANAKDFMQKLDRIAPFTIERCQTDNGSEFDLNFHDYILETNRIHYFNYPKSPKMNAFIERFNGSIQEEFVDVTDNDPYNDLEDFNNKLMDYLLFFNTQRVHKGIGKITPMAFIIQHLYKNHKYSNMLWTQTIA